MHLNLTRASAIAVLVLCGLVWLAYADAPANSFHFDDFDNIVDQPALRQFTPSIDGVRAVLDGALLRGRPLANLSFAVDAWRSDMQPAAFLIVNVHLQALTAVLLLALLWRTAASEVTRWQERLPLLCLAAAVWAVHPIQSQAVTYIVQRMTLGATLGVLISVLAYVCARRAATVAHRTGWAALAVAGWLLAAGCKENGWIAPALWWLAELTLTDPRPPQQRGHLGWLLLTVPLLALLAVLVDLLSGAGPLSQRLLPGYAVRPFTLEERLLTQPRVLALHLSQWLWPWPDRFSIEHGIELSRGLWRPPATLAALGGVAAWCGLGLWAMLGTTARRRRCAFWLLWLPVTLVIESSIVPLELVFEHRWHMASIGLAGLLAEGLGVWVATRPQHARWLTAGLLLILLALALATRSRVADWRDDLSLYGAAVRHAPQSGRAWVGYGSGLLRAGRRAEARAAFERASQLDPSQYAAWERLGVLHFDEGDLAAAQRLLQRALQVSSHHDRHSVHNHLGEVALAQGQAPEAVRWFGQAVELAPWQPEYRWNLAVALERLGRCREAVLQWQAVLRTPQTSADDRAAIEAHLRDPGAERCIPR